MEQLLNLLIKKATHRLDKEMIPSKRTLEIIDRIIQLNSLSQYRS